MNKRSTTLTLAVSSILLAAGAARAQEAAAPDPSTWTCSKCPFEKGYNASAELGAGYLSQSSAKFGDYTGLNKEGAYVVADAEGKASYSSGYSLSYELANLGLESREARIDGGKQGSYDFSLFYDRVPHYIADTSQTVFNGLGTQDLSLPAGWVTAGSTGGMTQLASDLRRVNVGYDRDRYGVTGSYLWGSSVLLSLDYRHDERDGTRTKFGSFGSTSSQLLAPVDDSTDRINVSARYDASHWFAQLGFYASIYDDKADALRWQNPFTAFVPGATVGQMALAPSNNYDEISISAGMHGLPWNTVIAFNAATGQGTQDKTFLPYTINPYVATDPLPMTDLHGQINVNRADLTVSMQPIDRLRLRGSAAYDEREDDSHRAVFTSEVLTDLYRLGGAYQNPVYGYDRWRLHGTADYAVLNALTLGVGTDWTQLNRKGTPQEVKGVDTSDSWGRLQYRPSGYLGVVLKGGYESRDADSYNVAVAESYGQNPLMRKYYLAHRYRSYGELVTNVALGKLPLTLSVNGFYADDNYDKTQLGLLSSINQRYGLDLTWAVNEKISAYVTGGYNKVGSRTKGSSTFSTPDWRADVQDEFLSYGGGVRAQVGAKLKLNLDYTHAEGNYDTTIVGTAGGAFPTVTSRLDTVKANASYPLTERMDLLFSYWYEKADSHDWAIQNIGPATIPTVLGLGIDPYNYDVSYVTLSVRYSFGPPKAAKGE